MKPFRLSMAALFFALLAGCSTADQETSSLCFRNASSSVVYNLFIGGESMGTVSPGQSSAFCTMPLKRLTASWSYGYGSTSYSFEAEAGQWEIIWDGTITTRNSL